MIELMSHQEYWSNLFHELKDSVQVLLGNELLTVEHFGSTAIPSIAAKPIIDIIGTVTSLLIVDKIVSVRASATIRNLGENGLAGRRYLVVSGHSGKVLAHVHLFESGDKNYKNRLEFRDYLRANPIVAREYEALKQGLAQRFPTDPRSYWEGKAAFVQNVLERVRVQSS